jgi:hypothetical protein
MLKTFKKSPQKKADTLDDVVLTIEFNLKKLSQKSKQYSEQIEALSKAVDFIEKAVSKEAIFKASELYKEFLDAKALVAKLTKDFETMQKRSHKNQIEFEKKLSTPLANGLFNSLKPAAQEDLKVSIKRIQDLLASNKKSQDAMIEPIQALAKRLAQAENKVHAICLPEQLEELSKLNEKLNKFAEILCKETAELNLNANPQPCDSQKIKASLLTLYSAHQKGGLLLEQAQKNLGTTPLPTSIAPIAMSAANITAVAPSVTDFKTNSPTK